MKNILIHLTDEEFKRVEKSKGKQTWKEFLLSSAERRERD